MAALQAVIDFPGVEFVQSCSVTLAHGTTPGVFRLTIAPQQKLIKAGGTLSLSFGGVKFKFEDCRIDSASITRNQGGYIVSLAILDRRWKWRFPTISGAYNVRRGDEDIINGDGANPRAKAIENSERTPQQLAKLCLEAMEEKKFDVGDIPNKARPEVDWDHTNAAQALASLCDQLGCRVVLQLDGKVAIRKAGQGEQAPDGPIMDQQAAIDPPERPDAIKVIGGRIRYQVDLLLEAVGRERDGSLKPINQLSYAPAGGWSIVPEMDVDPANEELTKLVETTIRRLYRITLDPKAAAALGVVFPGGGIVPLVPGFGELDSLDQILPLESEQVETYFLNDRARNRPAVVYGVWYDGSDSSPLGNSSAKLQPLTGQPPDPRKPTEGVANWDRTIVTVPWTLDAAAGMVEFSEAVYRKTGNDFDDFGDAALILRTAVSVRESSTRAWQRYEREQKLGGKKFNTAAQEIKRPEIVQTIVPSWSNQFRLTGTTDNLKKVDKEADHYLDAAAAQFETKDPSTTTYAGWLAINPDGALQSITWTLDQSGAKTILQRNQDLGSPTVLPFRQLRALEQQRQFREQNNQPLAALFADLEKQVKL